METKRLQRAGLRWGGLALVVQLAVGLSFIRTFITVWDGTRPEMVEFRESFNRFSQFKATALKYPLGWIYLVMLAIALAAILGWMTWSGLRQAMAAEPQTPDELDELDDPAA
jgi:hypothetical protein